MAEKSQPTQQTTIHGSVTGSAVDGGNVTARNIAGGDIHDNSQTHHHFAAQEPIFPINNLLLDNPHFVGRGAHLQTLATAALGSATTITQTIAGLGGVGKSQIMLHFAHLQRVQNTYDIIWWLRVDEALAEDFLALGRQLGLALIGLEQDAAVQLVRNRLNNSIDKRWLLLCDNADKMEPRSLRQFLPHSSHGRILITSRNPHWQNFGSVLRLDVFTPPEAAEFWMEKLGAGNEKARAILAAELGFFPLALEHAAAYMSENGLNATGYLTWTSQNQKGLT